MRGIFKHTYQLLKSYFAEVRLVDLDFVFDIQTTSYKDKRFTRYFWCFGPPKKAYKQLRPVAVIDRTFLKGRYCETLLTTIAIDPSNHIFPLAFSITDSETIESWTYFLEMFIVISDKNPKIINIVPKVFPFAIHTFCTFYILNNIKTTLESTRITFRMAAETLTSIDFDKHMNAIRNIDPVGLQYILGIPKEIWYNLYIIMSRYGAAYTNHVESWNNVILKVRDLPIQVFIEELRRICSEMSYTYREEAEKSQARLTLWATDHCESKKFVADSLTYSVCTSRHYFQMTSYSITDSVNIDDGTCSFCWWQTMAIPYEHGVFALGLANVDPTTRVSEYFTNDTYKAIYEPI
ncbi:hypothetical protein GIB67_009793 [Kingdonia uniflora]|uniref:MULE transposase domain-containing protein n=1 Tax=Kingdonia uniflora TaxID=39325 RepID=A0A7J7LXQ0_9MAGN|nr:hypothetical protein GIB67_009793 [Kingdonia uniflora]